MKNNAEKTWNEDLKKILKKKFKKFNIDKCKILRDFYLSEGKEGKKTFKSGFAEQDIVIYNEELDISKDLIKNPKNIIFQNDKKKIIIPKVIIELKYFTTF